MKPSAGRVSCGRLPEWDDRRIEPPPQAGRDAVNPAEGVRVGGWSGDEALRREGLLLQAGRDAVNPAEGA